MTKLLTAQQVADILGVKPRTVREWLRAGKIPGTILPDGGMRFNQQVIESWLDKRTIKRQKQAI